jgi:hypothetical protein
MFLRDTGARRALAALAALVVLAGCGDTLAERTLSGAGIGTVAAVAVKSDPVLGAIVGGGLGVLTR